jgi:hypothetical protein
MKVGGPENLDRLLRWQMEKARRTHKRTLAYLRPNISTKCSHIFCFHLVAAKLQKVCSSAPFRLSTRGANENDDRENDFPRYLIISFKMRAGMEVSKEGRKEREDLEGKGPRKNKGAREKRT